MPKSFFPPRVSKRPKKTKAAKRRKIKSRRAFASPVLMPGLLLAAQLKKRVLWQNLCRRFKKSGGKRRKRRFFYAPRRRLRQRRGFGRCWFWLSSAIIPYPFSRACCLRLRAQSNERFGFARCLCITVVGGGMRMVAAGIYLKFAKHRPREVLWEASRARHFAKVAPDVPPARLLPAFGQTADNRNGDNTLCRVLFCRSREFFRH